MPYIIMMIYLLLIATFEYKEWRSNKIVKVAFSYKMGFLVLFLFAALRGNGNGDYQRYIEILPQVNSVSMVFNPVDYPFEIGLRLIAFITNSLNLHPQFAIATMNAISFSSVYYFVSKHSKNKGLSLFLFYPIVLLFDMHHSRSAVAMSLGLVFFDSLCERKYLKSTLFITMSIAFHKSAAVLLILCIVSLLRPVETFQLKFKNKTYIKAGLMLIILGVFYFISPINLIINLLDNPITQAIHYKLVNYLVNDQWSYPFSILDPRLLIMIFSYLLYDSTNKYQNKFNNKLQVIQLFAILTVLVLSVSTILVIRTYNFFNLFSIVLIPNMLYDIDFENFKNTINAYKFIRFSDEMLKVILKLLVAILLLGYFVLTIYMIKFQFDYYTILRGVI